MTQNMPADWQPPAPAWESRWQDSETPLIVVYFGIQAETPDALDAWARGAFSLPHAPFAVEQGLHHDAQGSKEYIYIAYWRYPEYQRWWQQPGVGDWWADEARTKEGVGFWREPILMPFERFETLHSTQAAHGVGVSAEQMEGPVATHGYPGAMRDRIPVANQECAEPSTMQTSLPTQISAGGKRVRIRPPRPMCVIRSGQNWSHCTEEEEQFYLRKVHPVLLKGMAYLRDHPEEAGCYNLRFIDKKDSQWQDLKESFGLGYGADVFTFEHWAKSHPTHLAIFSIFMHMVETFGEQMQLRLWHEVTLVGANALEFEYLNCHPQTGLLPYTDNATKGVE